MTITLDPLWTYTFVVALIGFYLVVTDQEQPTGPGLKGMLGVFITLTIPFVWLGWWLR